MKVSVAMTVYNNSAFLTKQLESILNQSLLPDEVVICEDCSTDCKVREILENFRENSLFDIHIVYNEHNLGTAKNVEQSIRLCSGDIIIKTDSDDIWESNKIEEVVKAFQDPGVVYVYHNAYVIDGSDNIILDDFNQKIGIEGEENPSKQDFLMRTFRDHQYPYGMSLAIRRTIVPEIVPFELVDDQWIAMCAPLFGEIKYINQKLIRYRRHTNNQSGEGFLGKKTGNWIKRLYSNKKTTSKEKWFNWPLHTYRGTFRYYDRYSFLLSDELKKQVKCIIEYNQLLTKVCNSNGFIGIFCLVLLYKKGLYQMYRGGIKSLILDMLFII